MSLWLVLLSGMVLIVLSADYFTNGIEWLGFLGHVNEGATGSLLAAMGTALPETLVPVAAIYFGGTSPKTAISLGAIFGAPLMLATVGFFVIGAGLWGARRPTLDIGRTRAFRGDLIFFLMAFGLSLLVALLPSAVHPLAAGVLVVLYGWRAKRVLKARPGAAPPAPEPARRLHLYARPSPGVPMALLQVLIALFGMVLGAHFFVLGLDQMTRTIPISEFLLSVLITPVATELPEVFNSVIWIRRGRDTLALGNVTGAMAFQASVVPALGMLVTRWQLSDQELVTAVAAWMGALWVLWASRGPELKRRHLIYGMAIYLAFLGLAMEKLGVH